MKRSEPDFVEQTERHLSFIARSGDAFDAGHHNEALRIAVSLRVFFHDTVRSTSLLTHLGKKESVSILSTLEAGYGLDKATGRVCFGGPLWIDSSGQRQPPLGKSTRRDMLSVTDWMTEVIMCVSQPINRRDVILSAANQDGGAHVDALPSKKTTELIVGVGTFTSVQEGKSEIRHLDNHHFPLLRQFAYEVLNSPDLNFKG